MRFSHATRRNKTLPSGAFALSAVSAWALVGRVNSGCRVKLFIKGYQCPGSGVPSRSHTQGELAKVINTERLTEWQCINSTCGQ